MTPHCECALLHGDSSVLGCRECGTVCCRSCAVEVESEAYCRWCAMALTAAFSA